MFAKAAILSALFAGSALAAPTSSPRPIELERRADWQTGKCEAHIALNSMTHASNFSRNPILTQPLSFQRSRDRKSHL